MNITPFEMLLLFLLFLIGLFLIWVFSVQNFAVNYIFGGIVGGECVKIFYDVNEMRRF